MNIYYVRHGDPDYQHDTLTKLGRWQAKQISKYFKNIKIDKIFSSSLGRAMLTAKYTADKLHLPITALDWCREDSASDIWCKNKEGRMTWIFWVEDYANDMRNHVLDKNWYKSKGLKGVDPNRLLTRLRDDVDKWLLSMNIEFDREKRVYRKIGETPENIILFAHGGIGMEIIPTLLDMNYPIYCTTFREHNTCGITKITINTEKETHALLEFFNHVYYDFPKYLKLKDKNRKKK